MIKICDLNQESIVSSIVDKDKLQNVYLSIDIKMYGLNCKNIETSLLIENEEIVLILYKYYNSLQIFKNIDISEDGVTELCEYVEKGNFEMISGCIDIIEKIVNRLEDKYSMISGCIMKKQTEVKTKSGITRLATKDDCENIAKLICSDKNIGGHYTIDGLTEQLIDRMVNRNCKNVIIEEDREVVSHMGVYADTDDICVLGGLITKKEYQGKGYGKKSLEDLTYFVQKENKIPILYCYDQGLIKWYEKNDWKKITPCAKLEKNR